MTRQTDRKPKIFYGYWIVAIAFLCTCISCGIGTYSFSLFIRSLELNLGWSRGEIIAGFTICSLSMALASPFVGRAVDRKGAGTVTAAGAFVAGLGFLLLSSVQTITMFYIAYAIAGIGLAGSGSVPAATAISNWFHKRRGSAIGIMMTGMGAGGFVIAQLIGSWIIPSFGWQIAYISLALILWILIIPIALLFLKTRPSEMGLQPDGNVQSIIEMKAKPLPLPPVQELTTRQSLGTSAFWLIGISFFLHDFSQAGYFHNQVPFFEEIGFTSAIAATALSLVGLGSGIGKFGFGWLCDYVPAKYVAMLSLVPQTLIIMLALNFNATTSSVQLLVCALIFGLSIGAMYPTLSMLTASYFGLKSYGTIFGIFSFCTNFGAGTAPLLAGYLHDITGNYQLAFMIFIGLFIVSFITVMAAKQPKHVQ